MGIDSVPSPAAGMETLGSVMVRLSDAQLRQHSIDRSGTRQHVEMHRRSAGFEEFPDLFDRPFNAYVPSVLGCRFDLMGQRLRDLAVEVSGIVVSWRALVRTLKPGMMGTSMP